MILTIIIWNKLFKITMDSVSYMWSVRFWHCRLINIGKKNSSKCTCSYERILLALFDSSRRASHFGMVKRQNRIEMAELCPFQVGAKVASWPILGWKLVKFFETWTPNLVCPSFTLILRGKLSWKSIGSKLFTLSYKNHQNGHISKCHFV